MAIQKKKSRVSTSGGQFSLDAASAPGLAQMRNGEQLERIGDSMIAQSKQLLKAQAEADRASVLANASTQAQFELQQRLAERRSQVTDENGNPIYGSLDSDTQTINQEVINKHAAKIADPEARRRFVERMTRASLNERLQSQSIARNQQHQFAVTSLMSNTKALVERASVGAPHVMKDAAAELKVQTDSLVANGTITPQDALRYQESFRKETLYNRMKDAVTTNATGTLQSIEDGSHPLLPYLNKEEKTAFLNSAKAGALREDGQRAAAAKSTIDEVKNLDKAITSGKEINKQTYDAVKTKVEALRQVAPRRADALAKTITQLEQKQESIQKFTKLSPKDRLETLNALEQQSTDSKTLSSISKLKKLHSSLVKQAEANPLQYASDIGLVKDIQPLDVTQNVGEQLDARLKQVKIIEEHLGKKINPLTKEEQDSFVERYNSSDFKTRASMLGSMVGSLGSNSKQFLSSLAKNGQLKLAYVGNLVARDEKGLASTILRGDHYRKQKMVELPGGNSQEAKDFRVSIEDGIPRTIPSRRKVLSDSVMSIYAALSVDENDYSGVPDQERLNKAIEMVVGKPVEYNGEVISPPSKETTQADFVAKMQGITTDDITAQNGNLSPEALQKSKLVDLGDGRYLVMVPVTDPKSGDVIYKGAITKSGDAFIFDYNAVDSNREEAEQKRVDALSQELDSAKQQSMKLINQIIGEEVVNEMSAFENDNINNQPPQDAVEILKKQFNVNEVQGEARAAVAQVAGDKVLRNESGKFNDRIVRTASAAASTDSFIAIASKYLGSNERADKEALMDFFRKSTGSVIDPSRIAWCAKFVNSVIRASGLQGTGSNMARSFLNWGTPTQQPQRGDVVVFSRGNPNGIYGHVGFFDGYDKNGNIRVLGGNQSDSVSIATYSRSRVLGFRRPPDVQTIKNEVFKDDN